MSPEADSPDGSESLAPDEGQVLEESDLASERSEGPDRWRAASSAAGQRLDVYLARIYRTARSQTTRWIQDRRVVVGDKRAKPGLKLDGGEWISCDPYSPTQEGRVEPEPGELAILHEDAQLVVLDKPPHIAVHPGAGRPGGTLANRLLAAYPEMDSVGGPGRPGIVHRLDLGTSGVLAVARTASAHRALSAAFAERRVRKTYLAIGYGAPKDTQGEITAPIARNPQKRKEMSVLLSGRPAETGYQAIATQSGLTLFELHPVTGRTHQIRVHLKHIGHPIVGDPVYGEARWKGLEKPLRKAAAEFDRPALHAWRLELPHPETGEPCSFEAPPPSDVIDLWEAATGTGWPLER